MKRLLAIVFAIMLVVSLNTTALAAEVAVDETLQLNSGVNAYPESVDGNVGSEIVLNLSPAAPTTFSVTFDKDYENLHLIFVTRKKTSGTSSASATYIIRVAGKVTTVQTNDEGQVYSFGNVKAGTYTGTITYSKGNASEYLGLIQFVQ